MGVRLIREVLDGVPPWLPQTERLALVVLAENANDQTRTGYPGMDALCRRLGLSESGTRRVLQSLAAVGCEVRVPLGEDRNGRPTYAVRGRQSTYRIPVMADVKWTEPDRKRRQSDSTIAARKALSDKRLSAEKGASLTDERRQSDSQKALSDWPPSPQSPQVPSRITGGDARTTTHYARPAGVEPPPRCPDHIDNPTDAPCRACGTARKVWETWDRARILADAEQRSAAAKARAVALAEEIAACRACDHRGRLAGDVLCSHDPDAGRRRAKGAAAARNAIRLRLVAEA